MKSLAQLASRIFNTPLLIHPRKLDAILSVLGPRLNLAPFDLDDGADVPVSSRPILTADGAAVIRVYGTLVKRALGLDPESGMTSYESIRKQFDSAMTDRSCRSIVFDIDSPGGEASGLFDLCAHLFGARGKKPIVAFANDFAYSAAYAIASCADRVVVTGVGGVGSIGVYSLHVDQSRADARIGLKYTYIYSGDRKIDANPHEPLTKMAIEDTQREADRVRQMFVDLVARNRLVSAQKIHGTQAATYMGEKAVPLLADEVGTFNDALRLAQSVEPTNEIGMYKARLRALRTSDGLAARRFFSPGRS